MDGLEMNLTDGFVASCLATMIHSMILTVVFLINNILQLFILGLVLELKIYGMLSLFMLIQCLKLRFQNLLPLLVSFDIS